MLTAVSMMWLILSSASTRVKQSFQATMGISKSHLVVSLTAVSLHDMTIVTDLDRDHLRSAVLRGNVPTMLAVLLELTADERWVAPRYQPRAVGAWMTTPREDFRRTFSPKSGAR